MKTNEIKPLEIKLIQPIATNEKIVKTLKGIKSALNTLFNEGGYRTLYIKCDFDLKAVEKYLIKEFPDQITVRNSVSEGCYGSRTGNSVRGLTLYCALELFQECYEPECETTLINPLHEIENAGGELLDYNDDQVNAFFDIADDIGLDTHHDNTYNHEFEGCDYICDFTFKMIGGYDENKNILAVSFHCGGDIRGNYTNWYLFKFDDTDSLYSAILPYREDVETEEEA